MKSGNQLRHQKKLLIVLMVFAAVVLGFSPTADAVMCLSSRVTLSPTSHDYGNVNINEGSAIRSFTVTYNRLWGVDRSGSCLCNCSSPESVSISGFVSNNSAFTIGNDTCGTLFDGGYCIVNVLFNPSAEEDYSGNVRPESSESPVVDVGASLQGRGYVPRPQISFYPDSVNFGNVYHGELRTETVNVYNAGSAWLHANVSVISGSSSFFRVAPGTVHVGPGNSGNLEVSFIPTETGSFSGTILVQDYNFTEVENSFSIEGTALPTPNINTGVTNINFGDVRIGELAEHTLTISNEGDAILTGSINIPSYLNLEASLSGETFEIPPDTSTEFTITVRPVGGSRGPRAIQLTVTSNDPDAGSFNISGDLNVLFPNLRITPNSIDFGTVPVGETFTRGIVLENLNDSYATPLNVSSIVINNVAYRVAGSDAISLNPGETATVQVEITAPSSGPQNGILTINSNTLPATRTVALNAIAVAPSIHPSTLSIDWGDVHLGETRSEILTIENVGDAPLEITGIMRRTRGVRGDIDLPYSGGGSGLHWGVGVSPVLAAVAPGGSEDFEITFHSQWRGPEDRNLQRIVVLSNDPEAPELVVNLTGRGISPRIITNNELDFGNVFLDSDDPSSARFVDLELTISNEGNEVLSVSDISSDRSEFTPLIRSLMVDPGSTRSVQVRYQPSSLSTQRGVLQIFSNDYSTPVQSVDLNGRGVPHLDLSVSKVEVTQAIQDEDNSLPLIAGKDTVFRTFIDMALWDDRRNGLVRKVDGVLRVYKDGTEVNGSPFQSTNGPIDAFPEPNRENASDTLNFFVPGSAIRCNDCGDSVEVEFEVEVNAEGGMRIPRLAESDYENNTSSTSLDFWENIVPRIYYIPIAHYPYPLPPLSRMSEGTGLMRKIYPVRDVEYVRRPPLVFNDNLYSKRRTLFGMLFFASHMGGLPPPDRTYGWFPQGLESNLGIAGVAEGIVGRIAIGGILTNSQLAQETFAHEIGHTYGLCHTHFPVEYHCPSGYSDGHLTAYGTISEVGFDSELGETHVPVPQDLWQTCADTWLDRTLCVADCDLRFRREEQRLACYRGCPQQVCNGNGTIDLMSWRVPSYPDRWLHPQRYEFLFEKLRSRDVDPSANQTCPHGWECFDQIESTFLIAGSISSEDTVEIHPLYSAESIPDAILEDIESTEYLLRGLNLDGELLFEYPISSSTIVNDASPDGEESEIFFSFVVPEVDGLVSVRVVKGDEILAERLKTNYIPSISLISPTGGEKISDVLTVEWEATDEDNDELLYSVLYSHNGGETFQPIGIDLYETIFQYDTSKLAGTNSGVIRVVVSDGFNTTSADSNPFRIPTKLPEVHILNPQDGEAIFAGAPITFEADVSDLEDENFPQENITWESDLIGEIGFGGQFATTLPIGSHNISITVTDSDGNSTTQSIQIDIMNGVVAPRANAGVDQEVEEGSVVMLDASASMDPDDDNLTYEWTQIEGPEVILSDPGIVNPVFEIPQVNTNTLLRFQVRVTDSDENAGTDTVDISILNINYPLLDLSETEVDFGTVAVGSSVSESLTVSNAGNEPLQISELLVSQDVFRVSSGETTLAPGNSTNLFIEFVPSESARYQGRLNVITNTAGGVATVVNLRGMAPEPEVDRLDNITGGSLLPEPEAKPFESEPDNPTNLPVPENDSNDNTDSGSFRIAPVGGCSLVRYDN